MTDTNLTDWITYDEYRPGKHTATGEMRVLPGLFSPQLNNTRDLLVYLPPDHERSDRRYPVLYFHDGQNLFDTGTAFGGNEWRVDETLQALSAQGLDAIAVGLPNAGEDRLPEYSPFPGYGPARGEAYLAFIIETVKPIIDAAFNTRPEREHTGLLGSSMGGLISLYGFFRHPEVFGLVGGMSPSLWYTRGAIYSFIRRAPLNAGRIYIDNGTRENSAAHLERLLIEKGYVRGRNLMYLAEEGGTHTETAWARRLPDALSFLLGAA
jgi:predicted alpha/beta superfamily hydrolase